MQVGEIKPLVFYPNPTPAPTTPVSLTGATVTLIVDGPYSAPSAITSRGLSRQPTIQGLSMVVSDDGTYATRNTTPTDFPAPGLYWLVLQAVYGDGTTVLKSAPIQLVVGGLPPLE